MITKTEVDKAGRKVRIYHRAGSLGKDRGRDERYAWTHPYAERKTAVCCTAGQIPPNVRRAK